MITEEFRQQAFTLARDLLTAAEAGRVNSKKPKKAREIIERYKHLYPKWQLRESIVREWVNYLRSDGVLIGSNSQGYWAIVDQDGADETANQIESRMTEMARAYAGMFPDRFDGMMFRIQAQVKNKNQEILAI